MQLYSVKKRMILIFVINLIVIQVFSQETTGIDDLLPASIDCKKNTRDEVEKVFCQEIKKDTSDQATVLVSALNEERSQDYKDGWEDGRNYRYSIDRKNKDFYYRKICSVFHWRVRDNRTIINIDDYTDGVADGSVDLIKRRPSQATQ